MSALSGIKVLELSESVSGEYCGKLLSDFGADIIKLERPVSGSPTRSQGPFGSSASDPDRSGLFAYLNTGKHSVTLDLSSTTGREALELLLAKVDVVIDDHPAGWLADRGLDPDAIERKFPGLVLCSLTAYGQEPMADRLHAVDLNVFHASGWGYHTPSAADESRPPLQGPGRFLASYESGLDAAMCIVAALYDRAGSGLGRFIDISAQAVLASRVDYVLGQMVAGDMDASGKRTAFDLAGPAGIFQCRDGYIYIWMSAPAHWEALSKLLGDPDWMKAFPDRWLERECTPERVAQVRRHIGEWLKAQDKHEVAAKAQKLGLTLVAVNTIADLRDSPQYAFRGFFAEVDHPRLGRLPYPAVPYKLSATPARIQSPAPLLGQHNERLDTLTDAAPQHASGRA